MTSSITPGTRMHVSPLIARLRRNLPGVLFAAFATAPTVILVVASSLFAQEEYLGFHSHQSPEPSSVPSCKAMTHPAFDKLLSVLRVEFSRKFPVPRLQMCDEKSFRSSTETIPHLGRRYYVTVPASHTLDARSVPPVLAHELHHVVQYFRHDSRDRILSHYGGSIRSAELAADFGAGYILSKTDLSTLYEMNPALSGDFSTAGPDHHGTPSARAVAFRSGLFFTRTVSTAYGLEDAERYFLSTELRE